jgi:FSR family fosmidomycin resistance protein-like MFS transporter
VSSRDLDRRGLAALASGHAAADLCQGAVPALIPFLITQRGYSFGAAGALLLVVTISSSIVQPIFGAISDRLALSWLMPVGVLLAAVGVAGAGVTTTFPMTALAVGIGGLGIAAFHPEGARYANYASGSRRGTGMSLFSVGGNTGFAMAPVFITPAVLAFGLEGTLVVAIVPTLVAIALAIELPHLRRRTAGAAEKVATMGRENDRSDDDWGAFTRLSGLISVRAGVYYGLQTFAPVWLIHEYGLSEAGGNTALAAMLIAGACGTLVGGRIVDRVGRRRVLIGSTLAQIPLLLGFMLAPGGVVAGLLMAGIGFVTVMSFSVSVVMGQEYLPSRLGIASGVTLGLAIGMGGVAAAILGPIADNAGLESAMWIIAALPLASLALALTLPLTSFERHRAAARAATA